MISWAREIADLPLDSSDISNIRAIPSKFLLSLQVNYQNGKSRDRGNLSDLGNDALRQISVTEGFFPWIIF